MKWPRLKRQKMTPEQEKLLSTHISDQIQGMTEDLEAEILKMDIGGAIARLIVLACMPEELRYILEEDEESETLQP